MVNTYSDIAVNPGITGYPLVNQQTSGGAASDAQDAANFQRILDKLATANTQANSASATTASASTSASVTPATGSFKSFMKNLWDVVNPLQHIPVVSAIYRHATGDTISPGAHVAGDILYGAISGGGAAIAGGAISMADVAYQKATGKDAGETVIAALTGKGNSSPSGSNTMVAQNLTQITPAAGSAFASASATPQAHAGKGIWSANSNSSSSSTGMTIASGSNSKNIIWSSGSPLFPPSGTIGEGSASPSPAQPVLQASGAASTGASQTQEAPADAVRKTMSPELIASKMMDGLQKYAQMKQQSMNPQLSGLY